MKTEQYIMNLCNADRNTWIAEYRTFKEAIDTLEKIYRSDRFDCTPQTTVEHFIEAVGHDLAAAVIATLVIRSVWDGRISFSSEAWAKTIEGAFDEATAIKKYFYTNEIHMAHLDQLARAFIRLDQASAR